MSTSPRPARAVARDGAVTWVGHRRILVGESASPPGLARGDLAGRTWLDPGRAVGLSAARMPSSRTCSPAAPRPSGQPRILPTVYRSSHSRPPIPPSRRSISAIPFGPAAVGWTGGQAEARPAPRATRLGLGRVVRPGHTPDPVMLRDGSMVCRPIGVPGTDGYERQIQASLTPDDNPDDVARTTSPGYAPATRSPASSSTSTTPASSTRWSRTSPPRPSSGSRVSGATGGRGRCGSRAPAVGESSGFGTSTCRPTWASRSRRGFGGAVSSPCSGSPVTVSPRPTSPSSASSLTRRSPFTPRCPPAPGTTGRRPVTGSTWASRSTAANRRREPRRRVRLGHRGIHQGPGSQRHRGRRHRARLDGTTGRSGGS